MNLNRRDAVSTLAEGLLVGATSTQAKKLPKTLSLRRREDGLLTPPTLLARRADGARELAFGGSSRLSREGKFVGVT